MIFRKEGKSLRREEEYLKPDLKEKQTQFLKRPKNFKRLKINLET